jgi:ADP-heptose:LPS heptosyltransferase
MGDIVLTTPVIRCIFKQLPGVEIHYLTKLEFKPLLAQNPYIHTIHTLSGSLDDTLSELKKISFDKIIDLHHNLRSLRVKRSMRISASSFPKRNIEKWLLVQTGVDLLGTEHVVSRYFKAVKKLGVSYDQDGSDYFISEQEEASVQEYTAIDGGYMVLAIGAKFATKALPDKLAEQILSGIESKIYIIGGAAESERAEKLESKFKDKVQSLCGKLSYSQSAAIIRKARVLITPDTGMMHIGAALDVPVVSVWGSTVPGFGMTPFMRSGVPSRIIQREDLACRPCSKIGYASCPLGHFDCMNLLNAWDIQEAVKEIARPI